MGSGSFVEINIPPGAVKEAVDVAIREAIAKIVGKDPGALALAVAEAALRSPSSGYGKSPFAMAVDKMIHEEATAAVRELLEERKADIRQALKARIAGTFDPEYMATAFSDALLEQLTSGVYVQANVTITPRAPADPEAD